jgi:hypothetical protein
MPIEKPIGIALIVCDQIIQDASSGKRSLVGIFNSLKAASFPATTKHLSIYASLTNINGNVPMELHCFNETHEEAIVAVPFNGSMDNPNNVLDVAFDFDEFSFPKPGLYCFEIRAVEEIILSTRLNVIQVVTN